MTTPQQGQTWTPRKDVKASGGARKVVGVSGYRFVEYRDNQDEWHSAWPHKWRAWVARHAATTEGVEERRGFDAINSAFVGARKQNDTLRAALALRSPIPPQPAPDTKALLEVAKQLADAYIRHDDAPGGSEEFNASYWQLDEAQKAYRATLAALDAEPGA